MKQFITILDKATYSIVKHKKNTKLVSKNFRSNIMLAVTEVNGCIYCSYYHTKIALESGTTPEEMEGLLSGELSKAKRAGGVFRRVIMQDIAWHVFSEVFRNSN